MSKAFTRESDGPGPEEVPAFRPQVPPGAKNYITRQGAEGLKQRLDALLEQKRDPAVPESDRHKHDSNIRRLQQVLDSIVVADPPADREKVAFGATVSVRHSDGEEEVYKVVGVEEADPARDRISWVSPLARALLSHKAGETVTFQSPAGKQELLILRVSYPGSEAGSDDAAVHA